MFGAGFLDGNRAYGAVISGYTVSIVAVFQIDDPSNVFSEIVNRCAAIAIGIASITLVVDLFRGPEIGPALIERVGADCRKVRAFCDELLREGFRSDTDARVAAMMRVASDQHPLLNALPVEAVSGTARAGAVRATLAALVGELRAARALVRAVDRSTQPGDPGLRDLILRRLRGEFIARRETAAQTFAGARDGRPVADPPRMPIFRPRWNAVRNGLRAFIASVLAGYMFVLTGWPETSLAWGITGVIMCLSANAPNPNTMTKGAVIALPTAAVFAGITEFVILDGSDAFPLLMLGTAPALFAGLLLTSSPKPANSATGLLMAVFTVALLGPSNPQVYSARSYLLESVLFVSGAVLAFLLVSLLFPTTDAQRRRWALAAARRDMRAALRGEGRGRTEDEHKLLDASRIGTLVGSTATGPTDVTAMLRMADLARAARRVSCVLDRLEGLVPRPPSTTLEQIPRVRLALAAADAGSLRQAACGLVDASDEDLMRLAADLAWAADLVDPPIGMLRSEADPTTVM